MRLFPAEVERKNLVVLWRTGRKDAVKCVVKWNNKISRCGILHSVMHLLIDMLCNFIDRNAGLESGFDFFQKGYASDGTLNINFL